MKKIFLYVLLNVFIQNEISSRYSFARDYPFMEDYYSIDENGISKCKNLICSNSQLTVVKIELLIKSFNQKLNTFAERNNISNAYKLHWNKTLAQLAQNKSGKCLPPTYENGSKKFHLYDYESPSLLDVGPNSNVVLEVVIGERNISHPIAEEADDSMFASNMIKDYTTLFFSSSIDLKSRALNNVFGCGYIYLENADNGTFEDRLLCIFGFVHYEQYNLSILHGIPCSKCENLNPNDSHSTKGKTTSKKALWLCDQSFPYLCNDMSLNNYELMESSPDLLYCPIVPTPEPPFVLISLTEPNPWGGEESEWPCLPILIPLMLLIIIFLCIAAYHFVTALKFRYDT